MSFSNLFNSFLDIFRGRYSFVLSPSNLLQVLSYFYFRVTLNSNIKKGSLLMCKNLKKLHTEAYKILIIYFHPSIELFRLFYLPQWFYRPS